MNERESEISKARNQMVVQGNDFIRHARNKLSAQEMDIIYFWISKIKPEDTDFMPFTFTVEEFCNVSGIDSGNGKNYKNIKAAVKSIADKSAWVTVDNGIQHLVR